MEPFPIDPPRGPVYFSRRRGHPMVSSAGPNNPPGAIENLKEHSNAEISWPVKTNHDKSGAMKFAKP